MVAEVRPHEVLTKLVGVGSPAQGPFFCIVCSFLHFPRLVLQHLRDNRLHTYYILILLIAAAHFSSIPSSTTYTFASQGY